MKYKVGDKVRVRKDLEVGKSYYMEDDMSYDMFVESMAKWRGKIVTIERCSDYEYRIEGDTYSWTDEMFEPVSSDEEYEKIVITTDGKITFATLYKNDEVVKIAEAKCHDDDSFDFKESAKIAIERLYNDYTGKAVCVKSNMGSLTVGKVYNFAANNGCGRNNRGASILCRPAKSLDEINNRFLNVKFIEFKGEAEGIQEND